MARAVLVTVALTGWLTEAPLFSEIDGSLRLEALEAGLGVQYAQALPRHEELFRDLEAVATLCIAAVCGASNLLPS